jgi:hypothetical protein
MSKCLLSDHVLISTCPSVCYPLSRHNLCQLSEVTAGADSCLACNPAHRFQGSRSQNLLSRACHVSVPGDALVEAHQMHCFMEYTIRSTGS